MNPSIYVWLGFNVALAALLFLDLAVLTRRDRVIGMREAGILSAFWTAIALGMGAYVYLAGGGDSGAAYMTAYVAERALSIDNLFVFMVIFSYFRLPPGLQSRALLWGIVGALIARAIFIAGGIAVISAFSWVLFVLGAFLIYTAYKLAFGSGQEVDPSRNLAMRVARRFIPVSDELDGHNFFTHVGGRRLATPMLLIVIVLGTTDLVFAVDSIPTVFGITTDPFLVWTSNATAVLGMRPLFFLLAGLVRLFRYLQFGLAAILAFVGAKMITEEAFDDFHVLGEETDIYLALGIIIGILIFSVVLSALIPERRSETDREGA